MNSEVQFRIFTIVDLDKEEEYLHEMHLKGWRYKTSRWWIFYFEESEPDDVIYLVCGKQFFKKYYHQLENLKDRGWELVEVCPSSIFRKPASDLLPEDQVFYRNHGLRWEMVISRLRSSMATLLGGLVVCLILYRENLSSSFFLIFGIYGLMISYLIYGFFRLKRKYRVDKQ